MSHRTDFLFVTRDQGLCQTLDKVCPQRGISYEVMADFEGVLTFLDTHSCRFVFIDIEEAVLRGLQLMEWIQTRYLFARIGILAARTHHSGYLQALRLGALPCLPPRFWNHSELFGEKLSQCLADDSCWSALRGESLQDRGGWIGQDPVVRWLFEQSLALGQMSTPVLICGEEGVGKRTLARLIAASNSTQRLVELDLTVIPDYEQRRRFYAVFGSHPDLGKGTQGVQGLCLVIHGIDRLDAQLQEVLAEYFKEQSLTVEGGKTWSGDLRLIGTTTGEGDLLTVRPEYREDLACLLKQCCLRVPSLRARPNDLPLLVNHFLGLLSRAGDHCYVSRDAMTALSSYEWPGNVTELKGLVGAVLAQKPVGMIPSHLLPQAILQKSFYTAHCEEVLADLDYHEAKKRVLNKFNAAYIVEVLKKSGGNLTVAAEQAGMDRSNFKKIMKKYGIKGDDS